MEKLSGNKWKQRAPRSTRPYGSAFCSRNGLQKGMTCHDCHDAHNQPGQVVHFFFRARFAPFCARFARFRARFAEFIVQLCHAAMPQADEFSPWVFSTDSPMHQIASSTCTSFHGLAMFQKFHSMWNESDFRPGGGIRCKYLKTKACIQAWMEARMSSTSCAAALLVD